jgi:hypothetical protein
MAITVSFTDFVKLLCNRALVGSENYSNIHSTREEQCIFCINDVMLHRRAWNKVQVNASEFIHEEH